MDNTIESQHSGYYKALSGAAFFRSEMPGYFRVAGEDQRPFLQRQTTNNLDLVSSDTFLVTVLTSPAARIHDVLIVFDEGDKLGVLTLPGQSVETIRFLKSRIFFMDEVTLEDLSKDFVQLELLGPGSKNLIDQISGNEQLTIGEIHTINLLGTFVRILHQKENEFRLLIQDDYAPQVISYLQEYGATPLNRDVFNILRVEAGHPAAGHELTDEYTPLETGLKWTIAESKGCYTGQEVIARQINYDKVTRHLVGLQLNEQLDPGETLYPLDNDQPVGKITSTALSPRFGPIALAIIKRPFNEPGSELRVGNKEKRISFCTVSPLPFQAD